MQHARATLQKIMRDALRSEGADAPLLAWPLACGAKVAARTSALTCGGGVLTVCVPDEIWRHQLQSMSPQYLAALNQIVTEPISKIDFVTDPKN